MFASPWRNNRCPRYYRLVWSDQSVVFNEQLLELAPTVRRFESGTPPIPRFIDGASAWGVELLQEIGRGRVADHIKTPAHIQAGRSTKSANSGEDSSRIA